MKMFSCLNMMQTHSRERGSRKWMRKREMCTVGGGVALQYALGRPNSDITSLVHAALCEFECVCLCACVCVNERAYRQDLQYIHLL